MRSFKPPNLAAARQIVFDTETTGVDWKRDRVAGYVLALSPQESHYYPVRHEGGGNYEAAQVEAFFRDALRRTDLRVIGHALKFDVHMAANHGIEIAGPLECTMVNETLCDENQYRYNLDDTAARYGAQKRTDIYQYLADRYGGEPNRKQIGNFWKLSGDDPRAVEYATGDGSVTYIVLEGQQKRLDDENLRTVWGVECRTIRTLYRMERRGVRVDLDRLAQVKALLTERLAILRSKLSKSDMNMRSTKQILEAFLEVDVTEFEKTAKQNVSFTERWLRQSELGQAIVMVRKIENLFNSFINPLETEHLWRGRVHTNFNQLRSDDYGTVTGRLSSSGPNMQQAPKRDRELAPLFRSIFIPEDDHDWWSNDYMQCEFRIFADYAKSKVLIEGYKKEPPDDIHDIIARLLNVERDPTAKRTNLGMLYGMGTKKLARQLNIGINEAKRLWYGWGDVIPEGRAFLRHAEAVARARGWVRTPLYRRARLNRNTAHKAASRVIQGANADMIKLKAAEIDDYFQTFGDDVAQLKLSIHDELTLSVAKGHDHIAEEARRIMEDFSSEGQLIKYEVPMTVEQHKGAHWAMATFPKMFATTT